MVRTAINLYSVRDIDEPMTDVLDRVANAGYDGVQFSKGFWDATLDEVLVKLAETDLTPTAPHVDIRTLEDDLTGVLETYHDGLDCTGVVIPSPGDNEPFDNPDTVDAFADQVARIEDTLGTSGVGFHYHNHDFEFTDFDGETAFDRFLDATTLGIELDVGWAAAGGEDPAPLIERLDDRLEFVHMKDVRLADDTPVEIGTGDVDMQACADAARTTGADWLIYEHDYPDDPAASIDHGASFLAEL
jgi:sugar phosphate isomerase/epimerase